MSATRRGLLTAALGLALGPARASAEAASAEAAPTASRSWRVRDPAAGRDLSWDELVRRLRLRDAVFVGEQHDDPEAHRVEAALLGALGERAGLTLALEMLERDGQRALDDYLAGRIAEDAFTRSVTLWSNYRTAYRPLVEGARARRIPVRASNAPRRIVRAVSEGGLAALEKLPPEERTLVADYVSAPEDGYWERFRRVIGEGHGAPGGGPPDATRVRRLYEAQCVRDATMAETVARALEAGRRVLHINGSFHSNGGRGIPQRVLWRRPLRTLLAVVTVVPVRGDIGGAETGTYRGEADYVVLVPDRRKERQDAAGEDLSAAL